MPMDVTSHKNVATIIANLHNFSILQYIFIYNLLNFTYSNYIELVFLYNLLFLVI